MFHFIYECSEDCDRRKQGSLLKDFPKMNTVIVNGGKSVSDYNSIMTKTQNTVGTIKNDNILRTVGSEKDESLYMCLIYVFCLTGNG